MISSTSASHEPMHARQPEGVGGKPSSREVEQQAGHRRPTSSCFAIQYSTRAAQQRDVAATTNNPNVTAGFTCPPEMFEPPRHCHEQPERVPDRRAALSPVTIVAPSPVSLHACNSSSTQPAVPEQNEM
uniref:Uncharacterized protein n=1 Tax=Ananas comosus var. bracteatus TaxID=296719 RepID=A0A6V7QH38_ANACO|nr:unnamed protein product [Ananas comosus var. bracteatus]